MKIQGLSLGILGHQVWGIPCRHEFPYKQNAIKYVTIMTKNNYNLLLNIGIMDLSYNQINGFLKAVSICTGYLKSSGNSVELYIMYHIDNS